MKFELAYFQSNSCRRNPASKYLLKVRDGGNVVKFRVVNKDILITICIVLVSLLLTVGNFTTCFYSFCRWLWAGNSLMSYKLSICAVIRVDSITSEGTGIAHRLCIVHSFCFVVFPYEVFWFCYICCTFCFLTGQVTFVGYIGCNVPFWNFFSDILELGTYSECYCFVIPIIILVSTFFVLLCLESFAQSF